MIWLLGIVNAIGTAAVVFLAIWVWKLSREVASAKNELVIEKSTNALITAANESLKGAIEREKARAAVVTLPIVQDTASTEEAAASIRESLRSLAGLSVSASGTAQNRDNLQRPGTVYGPPAPRADDADKKR